MIVLAVFFKFLLLFFCSDCLFDSSVNKVADEMALEFLLCINFIFCEGYPMICAVFATDTVLPVEEGIDETICLELCVCLPVTIGIKELIAIV